VLTESVKEVVDRQADIGIEILNDGEFGKTHWYRYVIDRFAGTEGRAAGPNQTYFIDMDRERFAEFYAEYDKMSRARGSNGRQRGQSAIAALPPCAATSATSKRHWPASRGGKGSCRWKRPAGMFPELRNEFYRNDEEFVYAIAVPLREEYKLIMPD
jgi:5-methyltetrahydropteroyltriglutamate--homocysteine methyltransferase